MEETMSFVLKGRLVLLYSLREMPVRSLASDFVVANDTICVHFGCIVLSGGKSLTRARNLRGKELCGVVDTAEWTASRCWWEGKGRFCI